MTSSEEEPAGDRFELTISVEATATATHPPVEQMTDAERRHLGIGEQS
jgi:hypothetical protein